MTAEHDDIHIVDESLRARYRDMQAPPWLLAEVRRELAARPGPGRMRLVAYATLGAAALAVAATVMLRPMPPAAPGGTLAQLPSLSVIGAAVPDGSKVRPPSLAGLRAPSLPAPPAKPGSGPAPTERPEADSNSTTFRKIDEETENANT